MAAAVATTVPSSSTLVREPSRAENQRWYAVMSTPRARQFAERRPGVAYKAKCGATNMARPDHFGPSHGPGTRGRAPLPEPVCEPPEAGATSLVALASSGQG